MIDTSLHNYLTHLEHDAETIRKPEELAKRMARTAHMIRDIAAQAFAQQEASSIMKGLFETFKTVLLPNLSHEQFADMFAQTLAYGLFAARYNHKATRPFNRDDAAREIPRTSPFLRDFFATINTELDEEPFIGFVDELIQVLATTDIDAVLADFGKRTRREDPLIHFYETFLAQYDPKLRELRGVYYTPEPIVSYIVRSVNYLLQKHFDCPDGLADISTMSWSSMDEREKVQRERTPRVLLLDPACGTGTFLYAIVDYIREVYRQSGNRGMWSGYVRQHLLPRLFGFELLMAPYAVAHLKLGMQLAALDLPLNERADWAYDFKADERLGLYLTNVLEQTPGCARLLPGSFISDEANEAAGVKQDYPVMVVLGNPPYSGHSANKGDWIADLIETYKEGYPELKKPAQAKWLSDDYVKFIRFGQWRIEQTGYGILAFITNHSYLDNP
ncbi:MAG TPA: N-6 DNA methylase, partial [Ktedonobacteraceae bacterium]|nr:N-6 DNA methylase [Ktedonobacteraceae bacterium]